LFELELAAGPTRRGTGQDHGGINLPVNAEDFHELSQTLAQLPRPATEHDTMAACFLKAGDLPVVPQNVTTLGNFIREHPLIGQQLFTVAAGVPPSRGA